jgi:hypothetical protein
MIQVARVHGKLEGARGSSRELEGARGSLSLKLELELVTCVGCIRVFIRTVRPLGSLTRTYTNEASIIPKRTTTWKHITSTHNPINPHRQVGRQPRALLKQLSEARTISVTEPPQPRVMTGGTGTSYLYVRVDPLTAHKLYYRWCVPTSCEPGGMEHCNDTRTRRKIHELLLAHLHE